MSSPLHLPSCELSDCILDLSQFGTLTLPEASADLHFQIDLIPSECPDQVFFGLVHLDAASHQPVTGFAIHLDWIAGHVRDALNGFGILDSLDLSPVNFQRHDHEEPLLLSLKIEKQGANLFPTFEIGGARLLYPAITSAPGTLYTGIGGAAQPGPDSAPFCLFPALWMVEEA